MGSFPALTWMERRTCSNGCDTLRRSWPEWKDAGSRQEPKVFRAHNIENGDERLGMSEVATNLFVYGTLVPGESNYRQIEDFVTDHKPGTIDGVLVDLGAFPALVPGDGIVKGVMLRMKQEALEITDRIEGYALDRDRCLYLREEVAVRFEGGQEAVAWTYLFANSADVADCPRLVVGESDGIPIFAWRSE